MIPYEIIGLVAGCLTTGAMVPQAYQIYATGQTRDINFAWISALWIGTLLWLIYGWYLMSFSLVIFNGISLFVVGYVWCAKYDEQPIRSYRRLSEFFDQKTTNQVKGR